MPRKMDKRGMAEVKGAGRAGVKAGPGVGKVTAKLKNGDVCLLTPKQASVYNSLSPDLKSQLLDPKSCSGINLQDMRVSTIDPSNIVTNAADNCCVADCSTCMCAF